MNIILFVFKFVCQLEMSLFAGKKNNTICTHVYKKLIFSSKCNKQGLFAVVDLYIEEMKYPGNATILYIREHVDIIHGCTYFNKVSCGRDCDTCSLLLYILCIDAAGSNEKNVTIVVLTKSNIMSYSLMSWVEV